MEMKCGYQEAKTELAPLGRGRKVGIQLASIIKGWLLRNRPAALSELVNLLYLKYRAKEIYIMTLNCPRRSQASDLINSIVIT